MAKTTKNTLSESIAAAMGFGGEPQVGFNGEPTELPLDQTASIAGAQYAQNKSLSSTPVGNGVPAPSVATPLPDGPAVTEPAVAAQDNAAANIVGAAKDVVDADDDLEDGDTASEDEDDKKKTKAMTESVKAAFVAAGIELTEDFFPRLEAIFEAAVSDKVDAKLRKIVPIIEENFNTYLAGTVADLARKTDLYLHETVEQWYKENEPTLEAGIRTQITESFMKGLVSLFEAHHMSVPAEKFDVLKDLYTQAKQLEENHNLVLNELANTRQALFETECAAVFLAQTRDLPDTSVERTASLMENASFSSVDEYRTKLVAIMETVENAASAAPNATDTSPILAEETHTPATVITETAKPLPSPNALPAEMVANIGAAIGRQHNRAHKAPGKN